MAIYELGGKKPLIGKGSWVAPSAQIIGDVTIGKDCYIGFGAILRGDFGPILIGDNTLIEDNVVIHTGIRVIIGNRVIIGHLAMIHDAVIQDNCLVGMQSMICDNAVIHKNSILAEQSLVRKNQVIPEGKICAGAPAVPLKSVGSHHLDQFDTGLNQYMELIKQYNTSFKKIQEPGESNMPHLSKILKERVSIRAFLEAPVPQETLKKIFSDAQLSPSNCNVQPWQIHVVSGAKKDQLKDKLIEAVMSGQAPNPDFNWKIHYKGIHRDRQFGSANSLYSSMGIERSDKNARLTALVRNWTFFDAPHALFFTMEKYLDIMGAVDMGIYAQTLSLLMSENGIASCFQGALGQFPDPVRDFLNIPEEMGILFGMSFGYADKRAPINSTRTDRVPVEDCVIFWE